MIAQFTISKAKAEAAIWFNCAVGRCFPWNL